MTYPTFRGIAQHFERSVNLVKNTSSFDSCIKHISLTSRKRASPDSLSSSVASGASLSAAFQSLSSRARDDCTWMCLQYEALVRFTHCNIKTVRQRPRCSGIRLNTCFRRRNWGETQHLVEGFGRREHAHKLEVGGVYRVEGWTLSA